MKFINICRTCIAIYFNSIKQARMNNCIIDIKKNYIRNFSTQFTMNIINMFSLVRFIVNNSTKIATITNCLNFLAISYKSGAVTRITWEYHVTRLVNI